MADLQDSQLIEQFTLITGCTTLSCKHCNKTELPLENFVEGIRRKVKIAKGFVSTMQLPKTCDNQLLRSDIRNKIANPYYYKIRKATTPEEVQALKLEMKSALDEIEPAKPVRKPFVYKLVR